MTFQVDLVVQVQFNKNKIYFFFSYSIQAWIYIASGQHYGGCRTTSTVHMCRQTSRGTQGDNDKKRIKREANIMHSTISLD